MVRSFLLEVPPKISIVPETIKGAKLRSLLTTAALESFALAWGELNEKNPLKNSVIKAGLIYEGKRKKNLSDKSEQV